MILSNLGIIVFYTFLSLEHNVGFLLIRPFIKPNTIMYRPAHSLWPWVPVFSSATTYSRSDNTTVRHKTTERTPSNGPTMENTSRRTTVKKSTSYRASATTTTSESNVPLHNFWPLVPLEAPNDVKVAVVFSVVLTVVFPIAMI